MYKICLSVAATTAARAEYARGQKGNTIVFMSQLPETDWRLCVSRNSNFSAMSVPPT